MSTGKVKKPNGQVRQSQVVTTFGPGSLFDLPNHSAIVGGLEHWTRGNEIAEPRLVAKLKVLLGLPQLTLHAPPPADDDPNSSRSTGITIFQFPGWFTTQGARAAEPGRSTRSRRLVQRKALNAQGKFPGEDRKPEPVVPVRFVRACTRGHIDDIDWYSFVHKNGSPCHLRLWMDERGTSGDLSEIWVRCECGQERQIVEATSGGTNTPNNSLGSCNGSSPWLGPKARETCKERSRMLVRTASNAYFPQKMSVISIPDRDESVANAVDQVWEPYLQHVSTIEVLVMLRQTIPPLRAALEGLSDEVVFEAILARSQGPKPADDQKVKQAELETLIASEDEIGDDRPDGVFFARTLSRDQWDRPWMDAVERVVLVHRLREVVAQAGFTRFEPSATDIDGELEMGVTRAPLAREATWLPASENRGEGIFLQFRREAIAAWLERPEVKDRGERLLAGFNCWKKDHPKSQREFPKTPYIMLHSLSHLLITAVSLECGYPASSIRERIYAGDSGYGILLYTGSPDAEGTKGGLVEAGRRIAHHFRTAIDLGRLCSNDPVCAQHAPEDAHECRFLHGSACHGCLLIAETCCEQFNDFLDRALVVETVDGLGAEFFRPTAP